LETQKTAITQCVRIHIKAVFIHHLITMRRREPNREPSGKNGVDEAEVDHMAQENRFAHHVAPGANFRWDAEQPAMQRTPGARTVEFGGTFRDGQALAGSGALVFEGEVLDGPRFRLH
jgi:hypothetical protein